MADRLYNPLHGNGNGRAFRAPCDPIPATPPEMPMMPWPNTPPRRKPSEKVGRGCGVAVIGQKLAGAVTRMNGAELAWLAAERGTEEKETAFRRHRNIQSRVHALEERMTREQAHTLEGAAFAILAAHGFMTLLKQFIPDDEIENYEAARRALWSARHGIEQATGTVLPTDLARYQMPTRMDPFLALEDDE